jgi:predicted small lipoprotein YifL
MLLMLLSLLLTLTACGQNRPAPLSDHPDAEDIFARLKQEVASIPESYSPEKAVENGRFVLVHGSLRSDRQLADDFVATAEAGREASLVIVQYTIEGDPIITNLYFDGSTYYGLEDHTRDAFKGDYDHIEFAYQQLHIHETEEEWLVFLSNDPGITWERIRESLLSSSLEERIDWRLLYRISFSE